MSLGTGTSDGSLPAPEGHLPAVGFLMHREALQSSQRLRRAPPPSRGLGSASTSRRHLEVASEGPSLMEGQVAPGHREAEASRPKYIYICIRIAKQSYLYIRVKKENKQRKKVSAGILWPPHAPHQGLLVLLEVAF